VIHALKHQPDEQATSTLSADPDAYVRRMALRELMTSV